MNTKNDVYNDVIIQWNAKSLKIKMEFFGQNK